MYLTMNRFRVALGREADFEELWRSRESHLDAVPGFLGFHLMRGAAGDDHTLYASHTAWENEGRFLDWTRSEAFRAAHRGAGGNKDLYIGTPELETFATVLAQVP